MTSHRKAGSYLRRVRGGDGAARSRGLSFRSTSISSCRTISVFSCSRSGRVYWSSILAGAVVRHWYTKEVGVIPTAINNHITIPIMRIN